MTLKGLQEKRAAVIKRGSDLHHTIETRGKGVTAEDREPMRKVTEELEAVEQEIADYRMLTRIADLSDPSKQPSYLTDKSGDNPFNRLGEYRFLRAVDRLASKKPLDGLEGEIHTILEGRAAQDGIKLQGNLLLPHQLPMGAEGRAVTNTTSAVGALQTTVVQSFIDVLKNSLVLRRAGATVAGGLVGTVKLPKKTNKAGTGWVGEDTAPAAGTAITFSQLTLSPKNVSGEVIIGRDLTKQTSLDIEMIARMDLLEELVLSIDYGGLHGSGSSNQPQGIFNNSGCPLIALGTNGAKMSRTKLIEMMSTITSANVTDQLSWITNALGYCSMLDTLKISGGTVPSYLIDEGDLILGKPVLQSNQIRANMTKGTSTNCNGLVLGALQNNLVIGLWGGVDILVDEVSNKPALTIDAWQSGDIVIRQPEKIAKCSDLLP
jgi:HK97 family phage major capsid protein